MYTVYRPMYANKHSDRVWSSSHQSSPVDLMDLSSQQLKLDVHHVPTQCHQSCRRLLTQITSHSTDSLTTVSSASQHLSKMSNPLSCTPVLHFHTWTSSHHLELTFGVYIDRLNS